MTFDRNNLDLSSSPYLRQHRDNPVWWQEWSAEVLAHARALGRPLFVSAGYSTCHWCHVMAADAFSNSAVAGYLNEHFVSIKLDREQRPDIDHYLMTFLVATTGSGGWPLNAFLTPDLHPFFAMTYAGSQPAFGRPGFAEILSRILAFFLDRRSDIAPFELDSTDQIVRVSPADLTVPAASLPVASGSALPEIDSCDDELAACVSRLASHYDDESAGFGREQKFPPHAPLLFLQLVLAAGGSDPSGSTVIDPCARRMVEQTLSVMQSSGLHDHLQGGFFRYTVDRQWRIPHFEKMLYDQAMMLWNYSYAAHLTGRTDFAETAGRIIGCLRDTFAVDGAYAAGHDADTDHHEGMTYLWTSSELADLPAESADAIHAAFEITSSGNFEGRNHLIRRPVADGTSRSDDALRRAMDELLSVRRARPQPERDNKILTGWNALVGCGLVAAARYVDPGALTLAVDLARTLVDRFVSGGAVAHAAIGDTLQSDRFLSDHAALLLFLSLLTEHGRVFADEFGDTVDSLVGGIDAFVDHDRSALPFWIENLTDDFGRIPADTADQPIPSGVSLAELALARVSVVRRAHQPALVFGEPWARSFSNIAALVSRGYFHGVESPQPCDWRSLPLNSIQYEGPHRQTCFRGVCTPGVEVYRP
ncbi:MAG: thioredoxin domain-containing protein [Spirochaetaceae bacterium]|nr:MAG: thioredoxin domain-containing protein [Spirochaetaceae bacterium]